jgi:ABC-2 type transport system ATP-binding protein
MDDPIAVWTDVHRRFGEREALRGLSIEARRGEVLGILGPNGAGKTTALRILLGLRRLDSGSVALLGGAPTDVVIRRQIGVVAQEIGFPGTLRVGEIVDLVRDHFPEPAPKAELLLRFGLEGLARRQAGGLSGGEARRLALALAFAGRPRLIILDEPTTGLDVEARRAAWDEVRGYADDGGSVILTSHHLDEVEALAHRVAVVAAGRKHFEGTVDDVKTTVGLSRVDVCARELPRMPGAREQTCVNGRWTIITSAPDQVVRAIVDIDPDFSELEVRRVALEDAFLALTRQAAHAHLD